MAHVPRLALEHVNVVGLCLDMFEVFVHILCALNSSTNSRYHPEYVPRNQDLLISRTPTAPPYLQADRDSSAAAAGFLTPVKSRPSPAGPNQARYSLGR